MSTMKAVRIREFRDVDVMAQEDIPRSEPGPGQVLMRVVVRDADVVLDTVGGEVQQRSVAALRKGGTLVPILSTPSPELAAQHGVNAHWEFTPPNGQELRPISQLIDTGKLRPTVSAVLPPGQAKQAHKQSQLGHLRGKIVLQVAAAVQAAMLLLALPGCGSTANEAAAPKIISSKPKQVVAFDATTGALPEGVSIDGDHAYVGFAPTSEIVRVDLKTGDVSAFAQLPKPVPNKGFMTGVLKDSEHLSAALVSFAPEVAPGVYRTGPEGGAATLFGSHTEMVFPNGLVQDEDGSLLVTDSAAGAIFRVSARGDTVKWLSHDLLKGDRLFCGEGKGVGVPFDIGANGIARHDGDLYVTNTDRASIVRVSVNDDGSPGAVQEWVKSNCAELSGADGLTLNDAGDAYVAVNHQNRVVRISKEAEISRVATGAPLDFPASVALRGADLYVTNFAFLSASSGAPNPNPALMRFRGE